MLLLLGVRCNCTPGPDRNNSKAAALFSAWQMLMDGCERESHVVLLVGVYPDTPKACKSAGLHLPLANESTKNLVANIHLRHGEH